MERPEKNRAGGLMQGHAAGGAGWLATSLYGKVKSNQRSLLKTARFQCTYQFGVLSGWGGRRGAGGSTCQDKLCQNTTLVQQQTLYRLSTTRNKEGMNK